MRVPPLQKFPSATCSIYYQKVNCVNFMLCLKFLKNRSFHPAQGNACYFSKTVIYSLSACRCDGMVDVADSKSADGDIVWVRVPPPAPRNRRPLPGVFCFVMLVRDSKGAGVNDVPGARQSRAPARPQARSPTTGTTASEELSSVPFPRFA